MSWVVFLCVVAVVVYALVCAVASWRENHPRTLGEKGAESFIRFMEEVDELKEPKK